MEYRNGQTIPSILVIGVMIWLMDKVNCIMLLVTYMMESGRMIKLMVMEYIYRIKEVNMKDNGSMMNNMEKE